MDKTILEIERVRDINCLESIRQEWNMLLESSETRTVELSYEWQMTYWKYFNDHAELFILIVKKANEIVAIAPLKLTYIKSLGLQIRRLELIAAEETNYQDFIIGQNGNDVLECVLEYLLKFQKEWDILSLKHLPETSTSAQFFLHQLGNYPVRKTVQVEKCMFLAIAETSGVCLDEVEKKKKSRKNLATQIKKLKRDLGEPHLERSAIDQVKSDLVLLFDLHRKRWDKSETPSMFNDKRYREFYLDATQQLMAKGQIELITLRAGEIPLAQALNFIFRKNVVGQLLAYDINYIKYSPEKVLLDLYVNEIVSNGIEIMDFGSYNPYKEQWTNRLKNRVDFQVFPKSFLGNSIYLLTATYELTLTILRRTPILLNMAKYIRGRSRFLINIFRRDVS